MIKTTLLFLLLRCVKLLGAFATAVVEAKRQYLAVASGRISLALFVWLLTLHPAASGRVYAAYGGVYVCTALIWLRVVDGVKLSLYDWTGALIALCGMLIIVAGWGRT